MTSIKEKILIVEDSESCQHIYKACLSDYDLTVVDNSDLMFERLQATKYDLIILDVMLPGKTGFEACAELKNEADKKSIPVMFVSSKENITDRLMAFSIGAEDYLTKPFDPRELVARVKARLKATAGNQLPTHSIPQLRVPFLRLSEPEKRAWITEGPSERELELTQVEFDLLILFMKNPGIVLSRESVLTNVWGGDTYVTDRTVDTHVSKLRRKLGSYEGAIGTVRGFGYRLDPNYKVPQAA